MKVLVVDVQSEDWRRRMRRWAELLGTSYGQEFKLTFADGASHALMLLEQNSNGYGAIIVRDIAEADSCADSFGNVLTFVGCVQLSGFNGPVVGMSSRDEHLVVMIDSGCTAVVNGSEPDNHLMELLDALTRPIGVLTPA